MAATMENEKIASAMIGHNWEFNTVKSYEKWRNRALDTKEHYNFNPELDKDVRETEKHYRAAEDELGSWDVDKTTAHMGYDYYEYQADRDKMAAEEKAAKQAEEAKKFEEAAAAYKESTEKGTAPVEAPPAKE